MITDILDQLEAISSSPWFYLAIFSVAFLDSVLPVVPGETTVILGGIAAGQGDLVIAIVLRTLFQLLLSRFTVFWSVVKPLDSFTSSFDAVRNDFRFLVDVTLGRANRDEFERAMESDVRWFPTHDASLSSTLKDLGVQGPLPSDIDLYG
mgnify:CR=1 FL=1